jgi:hypothetical protein
MLSNETCASAQEISESKFREHTPQTENLRKTSVSGTNCRGKRGIAPHTASHDYRARMRNSRVMTGSEVDLQTTAEAADFLEWRTERERESRERRGGGERSEGAERRGGGERSKGAERTERAEQGREGGEKRGGGRGGKVEREGNGRN